MKTIISKDNTFVKLFVVVAVCFATCFMNCADNDDFPDYGFNPDRLLEESQGGNNSGGNNSPTTIFSENFDGTSHGFTIVNGSQTNKWHVGTAVRNSGTRSAYISNNNGTSNAYTITTASTVHMYRDITFPASSTPYTLTFRWRSQGESNYDYLRVFLVPTSTTPSAGTQLSSNQIGSTYYQMGGTSTWNLATISIPAFSSATTRRLIFSWINDSSVGTQPPAAIDDIVITGPSSGNVPSAPTGVTATPISSDSMRITWNAVSGATGYYLYYSTSPTGTFTQILSLTGTAAIHHRLTANTTYYYQVAAYNSAGTGNRSSTISATTLGNLPPAPTGVTAAGLTSSTIRVYWTPVAGATGYYIYRSTSSTGTFTRVDSTTSETSWTNTQLPANTTYYYRVAAYNSAGVGNQSSVASATTLTGLPAPTGVTATAISSDTIRITWNAVSGATEYNVYQSTSATETFTLLGTTTGTFATIYGLDANTTYYYQVAANNSAGTTGAQSITVSATTFSDNQGAASFVLEPGQAWTDYWEFPSESDGLILLSDGRAMWISNYCDNDDVDCVEGEWYVYNSRFEWSQGRSSEYELELTYNNFTATWWLDGDILWGMWPSSNSTVIYEFKVTRNVNVDYSPYLRALNGLEKLSQVRERSVRK